MAGRRLAPEEAALWARVAATVTRLGEHAPRRTAEVEEVAALPPPNAPVPPSRPKGAGMSPKSPGDTLDGSWDRRLSRGLVAPERKIDLHGHTLSSAHAALQHALGEAVADEVRVLLVITGRPRGGDARRGLIRAEIGDWLAASPYRDRIAAIRHAHPRHGGAGALYLVLRRRRA